MVPIIDDLWHVIVRGAGVLVLNPPSLPTWATCFLLIIRTVVVVVLFRRNIAPFILAKVSRRIRARSISPRSIRGLYFHSHGRTWKIERIGWSFHPWGESRLSVKIEGLHVDISVRHRRRESFQRASAQGRMAFFPTIRDIVAFPMELTSRFNWVHKKFTSTCMILARLFVRCLPSLTQNLDFDLDSVVVSFAALSDTQLMIRGITLNTKIEFSQLDREVETFGLDARKDGAGTNHDKPLSWNLFSNADRFWDRLWGQTQAFASVNVTFDELTVWRPTSSSGEFTPSSSAFQTAADRRPASEAVVHIPTPLRFVASLQFTPKLLTVERQSIDCSMEIPAVDISANGVRSLMHFYNSTNASQVDTARSLKSLAKIETVATSPTIAPLSGPASPTSPFMSALSRVSRHVRSGSVLFSSPPVQRIKDPIKETSLSLFRSIQLQLRYINVTEDLVDSHGSVQARYVARLDGFRMSVGLSDPRLHSLHRTWLGSSDSPLDGTALNVSCQFDLATFKRASSSRLMESPARLLAMNGLDVDALISNWPQPWIPAPRIFSTNPNGPFVACHISINKLDLFERLDEYFKTALVAPVPKVSNSWLSFPSTLTCVPRVELRAVCGEITARFACTDRNDSNGAPILETHTAGFNIGLSTAYRTITSRDVGRIVDKEVIQLDITCHLSLRPIFVHVSQTEISWGYITSTTPSDSDMWDDEPLFGIDAVDFVAVGNTLGHLGASELAVLQPYTTMMDIKCITEGISVEMWKPECIRSMSALLDDFRARTTHARQTTRSNQLKGLYPGITLHLAVRCLTGIITAKDINPSCDLELSRGLALGTGFSLQYSCMQESLHSSRVKNRFSIARCRQQLGLSEDLFIHSMAIANAEAAPDDTSALIQCTTWHTMCRPATSTRYMADSSLDVDASSVSVTLCEGVILSVPGTSTKIRLRRSRFGASEIDFKETCDISMEIPHIRIRFDLLNAYSALLTLHASQLFTPRNHSRPVKTVSRCVTSLRVRMESVHIFCQFPLQEQLFVRLLSSSLEWKWAGTMKADCRSIVAWVPSAQSRTKWEELCRLRDLSVILGNKSEVKFTVTADGFRFVIPHRYALSELVLNVGLMIKSLRHLRRTVKSAHYTSIGSPVAEEAKVVPRVNIRVNSLTLEAADSSFEAKLGLIWRSGFQAQKVRVERELAFDAKIRAILASGDPGTPGEVLPQSGLQYHFTSKRTTSVADARNRLFMIHSNSWLSAISRQKEDIFRKEESILRQLRNETHKIGLHVPIPISIKTPEKMPPLFRAVVSELVLSVSRPAMSEGYKGFLKELGDMPSSTEYSLLLPMHLELSLKASRINIRDYPLPFLSVPFSSEGPSLEFMTDLIIAEEMGDADSVEWFECPVFQVNTGIVGAKAFHIRVPKTIMPVKSYASPKLYFHTPEVTHFTWGVSYNPAIQEVMRVIETLSHPPRDPSPAIGFWDKLRLVFHWRIDASFKGGARFHFKGSRDPYHIIGIGAGFDFCWDGNVAVKVGYANEENELIQLTSDSMTITIPNHKDVQNGTAIGDLFEPQLDSNIKEERRNDLKVCAKFSNGIRWGVGITLERTCGTECDKCHGDDFSRECRFFAFIPHHQVVLHTLDTLHNHDSYTGFRSNFIHFSTSLTSPLRDGHSKHNSFHLTPRTFAHFWSWWHLFDGALSLPIRQGTLFPDSRPPSKKFGRHLATLKYRISFSPLYITHVYKIDSGDAWSAGESRCVGVKAFIQHFQADMHQREEETSKPTNYGDGSKIIRHKPFSSIEVVIKGLDLRALFAVFFEPQKQTIQLKDSLPGTANFWESLLPIPSSSSWVDADDFIELDWSPSDLEPNLYLLEAASCPRFVYLKRTPKTSPTQDRHIVGQSKYKTKFGDEVSHICLMGKEPTAQEVQLEFGAIRLAELRARLEESTNSFRSPQQPSPNGSLNDFSDGTNNAARETSLTQMIALLERYTNHLSQLRSASFGNGERGHGSSDLYDMPTDIKLPHVGEFVNVYQVHCPRILLNNGTRNILQQYYLASRARRGFEYHMSTRAVKFIRDQAHPTQAMFQDAQSSEKRQRTTTSGAQAAANAFRRILTGEERHQHGNPRRNERQRSHSLSSTDPLFGWDKGVSEKKAHLCLLLKPQIVLRSDKSARSVLVLAADHVVLRNHGILDTFNAEDPVSGYVMQRNYADINSLQMFQPVMGSCVDHLPLEVFVDYRCESRDFERLVPQTHATLRYDKFNRLRLRNNVTSVAISSQDNDSDMIDHLLHETDLIVVQVPRFTVSANASAFASMSDVVTNLLLFRDPVHKARATKLETMLFSYNFNDLASAAQVVADLQSRIRQLIRIEGKCILDSASLDDAGQNDLLASKAHILTLSQELNLIFDAIKLAQDKIDDRNQGKKSALHLQASSSEISWNMVDENRELLAKLAVRGVDYSWLSRQDSSSESRMDIHDLQMFDGSPNALWPEILAKHDDPPTHHMIRRGIFAEVQWSVLAPVGGIQIYDRFEVELHPIRLALETQLGNKVLQYLVPGRRSSREEARSETSSAQEALEESRIDDAIQPTPQLTLHPPASLSALGSSSPRPRSRKERLVPSRSFSNLRSAAADSHPKEYHVPGIPKSRSSTALVDKRNSSEASNIRKYSQNADTSIIKHEDDASEMRQRSSQKTFVHVKVPSVHVLLSVMKGRTFLVRDARLRTHDLEWRNRTWSFEELISQFIPSDPSWRGWVKVAWQQHVFSVGGVVKELITKTQWGRMGKNLEDDDGHASRSSSSKALSHHSEDNTGSLSRAPPDPLDVSLPHKHPRHGQTQSNGSSLTPRRRSTSKTRIGSLFRRPGSRNPSIDWTDS